MIYHKGLYDNKWNINIIFAHWVKRDFNHILKFLKTVNNRTRTALPAAIPAPPKPIAGRVNAGPAATGSGRWPFTSRYDLSDVSFDTTYASWFSTLYPTAAAAPRIFPECFFISSGKYSSTVSYFTHNFFQNNTSLFRPIRALNFWSKCRKYELFLENFLFLNKKIYIIVQIVLYNII